MKEVRLLSCKKCNKIQKLYILQQSAKKMDRDDFNTYVFPRINGFTIQMEHGESGVSCDYKWNELPDNSGDCMFVSDVLMGNLRKALVRHILEK